MSQNGLNVIALKDAMERNPQNLDESEILVSCLKKAGVVEEEYGAEELRRGVNIDLTMKDPLFMKCNDDPLNFSAD